MENIRVIFTGGTIGSLSNGNDISPDEKTRYLLLDMYGKNPERFLVSSPLNILSENANLADVCKMAREIQKAQDKPIKGIIMTHGTDTLAYSGALLSLLVQKCKVPVVLVGSNYVLSDKRANGVINFETAVDFIDNREAKPGIYVAYKNPEDGHVNIHLGSRMCEPPPYSDSFHSPIGQRYAMWKDGEIIFENTVVNKTYKKFQYAGALTKKGLFIQPYTGLDYNIYKDIKCDFILHNLYHSGTANTSDYANKKYETNFLNFADNCNNKKTPLYLCNIHKKDVNYNSTNKIMQKNIKFLYDILPNVALAKLYIAYNLISENERETYLNSNIAGEILEEPIINTKKIENENIPEIIK